MSNTSAELRKQYQDFFTNTHAGQRFMANIDALITDCHEQAENDPDHARDHVQRAKGIRLVQEHIKSIRAGKKVPTKK